MDIDKYGEDLNIEPLHAWIRTNGIRKTASAYLQLDAWDGEYIVAIDDGYWRVGTKKNKTVLFLEKGEIITFNCLHPFSNLDYFKYEALSTSTYYIVALEKIFEQHEDIGLLRCVYHAVANNAQKIIYNLSALHEGNAYREVKMAIEWLYALPVEIKRNYSAISFILETTTVSRSHALSILKSLRQGGYIVISGSGHLIKIEKKLPLSY